MVDIQKLELVQSMVRKLMEVSRDDLIHWDELGKQSGEFEVLEEGSIDEAATFKMNGCGFVVEDESSALIEEFDSEELTRHYENRLVRMLFGAGVDYHKLNQEQKLDLSKSMGEIEASVVARIAGGLGQDWMAKLEAKFRELESQIPGFEYCDWEEIDLDFAIDGEKYTMSFWKGSELHQGRQPFKTITELKKEQA